MEEYMALIWCGTFVLAAIVTPGELSYATFITATIVTILTSVSNVPYSVDSK